jgi:putative two-component system response regulator
MHVFACQHPRLVGSVKTQVGIFSAGLVPGENVPSLANLGCHLNGFCLHCVHLTFADKGEFVVETILLIFSSPEVCASWQRLLSNLDCEVICVGTDTAASLSLPLLPDLILLSDSTPDFLGCEFVRKIKTDPRNRLTPVVYLNSAEGLIDFSRVHEAGVDEVWAHSFSSTEALGRVQFLLERKALLEEQTARTILSLPQNLDLRESNRSGHSERVSNYAVRLGTSLQLGEDDLSALRMGGLLHDIGKLALPDELLRKQGPLTRDEIQIFHRHPLLGEEICAPFKTFRGILPIIRHHHERMDGSGYPDGLAIGESPLTERILQIVEFFEGLLSDPAPLRSPSLPAALARLYDEANQNRLDSGIIYHFGVLLVGEETANEIRTGSRSHSLGSKVRQATR